MKTNGTSGLLPEERKRRERARSYLNVYRARGKVHPGPCEICGTTDSIVALQENYDKPLEVRWLCKGHFKVVRGLSCGTLDEAKAILRGTKVPGLRPAYALGDVGTGASLASNSVAGFWELVDVRKDDECWEWKGRRSEAGYGVYSLFGESGAHRVAWTLRFGFIDRNMFVCHRCDNPPCVNISHLFLGTPRDNTLDCISKGRAAWQKRRLLRQSTDRGTGPHRKHPDYDGISSVPFHLVRNIRRASFGDASCTSELTDCLPCSLEFGHSFPIHVCFNKSGEICAAWCDPSVSR